tara:strand:- start:431 stop:1417 length:987 start_codon:yes stop_codon:yes gene_type:complete
MIFKSYIVEKNISIINQNLILFYGENIGLKNYFKNLFKKTDIYESLNFNQDEIIKNKNLIINEVSNISLFGKKKIIFIDQVNDKFLDIAKEVSGIISENKIIFFSEILDKKSKVRNFFEKYENCAAVACYPDNELTIKKIILERLRGFEGLSTQNLNLIIDSCKLDRVKLNNELEKIISFFQDKKIVTEKLQSLLNIASNEDFNLLKDAALTGNKMITNKLLNETLIEPDKIIYYLNVINQRLNKLKEINSAKGSEKLEEKIKSLKPPIFWKDKNNFVNQAKLWNTTKIKNILNETYNLEIKFKSNSTINKNVLIKKLIIDICEQANF